MQTPNYVPREEAQYISPELPLELFKVMVAHINRAHVDQIRVEAGTVLDASLFGFIDFCETRVGFFVTIQSLVKPARLIFEANTLYLKDSDAWNERIDMRVIELLGEMDYAQALDEFITKNIKKCEKSQ